MKKDRKVIRCRHCMKAAYVDSAGNCSLCGMAAETMGSVSTSVPKFQVQPVARPRGLVDVEVAVTEDRTASGLVFDEGIKQMRPQIFESILQNARNVRVWYQSHGDRDFGQDEVLHTDGGTPAEALADAAKIVRDGGGDLPEHHLDAVITLLRRVPWSPNRAEARRILIVITTDDTKPASDERSAAQIGVEIKESGIYLFLIGQATPTLLKLVKAAGGVFLEISNDPKAAELRQIGERLAASLTASLTRMSATRPASAPTV